MYSQIYNASYVFWGGNSTLNYTSPVSPYALCLEESAEPERSKSQIRAGVGAHDSHRTACDTTRTLAPDACASHRHGPKPFFYKQ